MAATFLDFNKVGHIEETAFADLLNKAMDMVINRFSTVPIQGQMLVRKETNIPTNVYKETTVGSVLGEPKEATDTDNIPMDSPAPGYDGTATIIEYMLGLEVPKSFQEDQFHDRMAFLVSGLPAAGRRKIELAIKLHVTNMFATTAGTDGLFWADTDHPNENPETGTWDNLSTGALSHSVFSTLRTSMRRRTDERGHEMPLKPEMLWVGPDTQEAAEIIRNSEKVSGGSLNDDNTINNGWEVSVYDYMNSTTQFFVQGTPIDGGMIKKGLVLAEKVAPQILPITNVNTSLIVFARSLRMRFATLLTTDRSIQGSVGT